jgi:hypothetical protein
MQSPRADKAKAKLVHIQFKAYLEIQGKRQTGKHISKNHDLLFISNSVFFFKNCISIVIQGISLWLFFINIYCTLVWFIPSIILPFPTALLEMTVTGFSVPYSYMYRKYVNHVHPPSLSSFALPLLLILSSYHDLFQCLFIGQWGFALVFYLWIYCTLISLILSINLPYPFFPILHCSTVFSYFVVSYSYTDVMYFNIIHSLSLFSSSLSLL